MFQQSPRLALWTGRANRFYCYHQSEHSEVHKPDATHSEQGVLLLSKPFSAALQRLELNKNVSMVVLNTYLLFFFTGTVQFLVYLLSNVLKMADGD